MAPPEAAKAYFDSINVLRAILYGAWQCPRTSVAEWDLTRKVLVAQVRPLVLRGSRALAFHGLRSRGEQPELEYQPLCTGCVVGYTEYSVR